MELTTKQVADKLDISVAHVRSLRDQGKLQDVATRKEGATKHFSLFDSKQVAEFAKTFKARAGGRRTPRSKLTNGATPSGPLGVLARLEDKLDGLTLSVGELQSQVAALLDAWK